MINRVFLVGNLIKDPEFFTFKTKDGKQFNKARFVIAVNKNSKSDSKPMFVNIEAYDASAEYVKRNLQKGTGVVIDGVLDISTYTDKDGQTKSFTAVRSKEIALISRAKLRDSNSENKKDTNNTENENVLESEFLEEESLENLEENSFDNLEKELLS